MIKTEVNHQELKRIQYEKEMILYHAQIAYEAYCKFTDWKSLATGQDLPSWEKLPQNIKDAWCASTHTVLRRFHESRGW